MKFIKQLLLLILIANILAISRVKRTAKAGLRAKKASTKARYSRGEETTQVAFNGGSWGSDAKIYLKEVDGPSSYPDIRGIVFSTNFGRNNLVAYTYNNFTPKLNVYYLPYRNLNSITCQASGTNRAITSDGTTTYDIWLNVWESECNTIVNYMDNNRRNRQATLAQAAKDLSTYATDYVNNLSTYEGLVSGATTLSAQITTLTTQLGNTNADITKYTTSSSDTGKSIAAEQISLSNMFTKSSALQTLIDSNSDQIVQIQASIESLKLQGTAKATTKTQFQTAATAANMNYNTFLEALKIESPGDAQTLASTNAPLLALNMDYVQDKINSVIPQ
jgi:hypothetical protein